MLQSQGKTGNWLILTDTRGLGEALSHELETNPLNTVIRVPNATGEVPKVHELDQLRLALQDLEGSVWKVLCTVGGWMILQAQKILSA